MGCAVASAAMLADLSYEEAAAQSSGVDPARLRWPKELCGLLRRVTRNPWRLTSYWFPLHTLRRFSFPSWPVAAFVQDGHILASAGQWIVVKRDVVHDPGTQTVHTLTSYPLRAWRVSWLVEPVRPAEFARRQGERDLEKIRNVLRREIGAASNQWDLSRLRL
jgi:hypothetical protein